MIAAQESEATATAPKSNDTYNTTARGELRRAVGFIAVGRSGGPSHRGMHSGIQAQEKTELSCLGDLILSMSVVRRKATKISRVAVN